MIPEASMTLDSILEGILDDEQSQSAISFSGSASPTSSSISASSPLAFDTGFSCSSSAFGSSSATVAGGLPMDPIPGIPCISIKTELPDSCSMDIMMEFTDSGSQSLDSSPRELKLMEAVAVASGDIRTALTTLPLSPASPDRQHCSSTTQLSETGQLIPLESIKDEDGPKRMCLVCGDVASGFHYGVSSCEACKAFFKRTIQGNIDYNCPASSDCEINKRRRKACQACRFQKCLRMGMLKEGVRLDRVRGGRQKYRRILDSPYNSIHTHRKTTLEDNKLLHALNKCEPEPLRALPDPTLPSGQFRTISTLADFIDRELVNTIGWAKQIPGFSDLSLNDQMRLLQISWPEIMTLSLCFRSMPRTNARLNFAADFYVTEQEAKDCGLTEFFNHCTNLTNRLDSLSLRKEEYLLLKSIVISNSDIRVDDYSALKRLRENLINSLFDAVSVIRSGNPGIHVQNLLLVLPLLRQSDSILRQFWQKVRQDGKVILNKLLVEMIEAQLTKS